jgi:hypothetical protein
VLTWSLRPATLADMPFLRLGFVPDGETETEYRLRRGAIA